ncbi:VOC family protein [Lysinibacillus fusiformis]|uniref:VOC family protein n=1 Tax=Lysinibacillus fusiformis TaxID=28031 RepID=UPI00068725CE|nr:VOC family protein [Lysinibacillus fusiformis]
MEINMRLELFVQNLKRSVDFYKNVIQLELYSQNETSASFKSKNLNILLTQQNILSNNHYFGNINTSRKGVGVEIIIIVPDIQSFHQRVCEMQIELESQLKQQEWGLKDFRLVDPDGYYLRISSAPK